MTVERMKHKELRSIRENLVRLYDIALGKEIHHAAWFSATHDWKVLGELLDTSEPYLASEGKCRQEEPIKMPIEFGNLQHLFYGEYELMRGLEKACFGFGDAIKGAKLIPATKLPNQLKQTEFDLLNLAFLVYFTAANEQSIIDSVQTEYQPDANDHYFEYFETHRRRDSFSPIRCFFGSPVSNKDPLPCCLRIYTESDFIRLAIESLDFQLFILPGLNEAVSKVKRYKAQSNASKSQMKSLSLLSQVICYWLKNQGEPPTLDEMAKSLLGGPKPKSDYTRIRRAIKLRYPKDKRNQQFQRDYLSGELIRVLLTDQVYQKAELPSDSTKLLTGKWDKRIEHAAGCLLLTASEDSSIQLEEYSFSEEA
jgi:hypothetical protein